MNKNAWFWIVIAVLVVIAIIVAVIPSNNTEETIKFGWIGPLTGDVSSIGQPMQVATQMAVEEINANGGINGKKIEVVYEDGKCNSKDASAAANKLINIDKVHYIIGGACSSETLATAALAEPAKVLEISPASSAATVSNAGDYIFRIIPSDDFQAQYAAKFAYNELGKRKVAIISCLSDWCVGLKNKFAQSFEALGGQVVDKEDYEQTAKDLKTQIEKAKAAEPDLIYFLGYTDGSVVGLKQMKELGVTTQILGGDTFADPKIWEEVGTAGDSTIFVVPKTENPADFVEKMKARGSSAEVYTSQAYDVPKILAQQIAKVGDDPTLVKDSLYAMAVYHGVGGNVEFDMNGDVKSAAYLVKEIRNGKMVDH